MYTDTLGQLEVKMLLKLHEKTSLSKTAINKCFWHVDKNDRKVAMNKLVIERFIKFKQLPKPKAKKTPVYFFLTEKGEDWVDNYIKNIP